MSVPLPDAPLAGASLPNRLSPAARGVLPALQAAADRTGVDFEALFHTARLESGFNPEARARTSSATGLFQFLDSTWLGTLARHGARHGLQPTSRAEALALRTNPLAASLMAAEHMADNAQALESRLGRAASPTDLYLAHFLGAGGAVRFLEKLAEAPETPAAQLLPAAAGANRSIFFANGSPRSVQQVHDLFASKLGGGPSLQSTPVRLAQAALRHASQATGSPPSTGLPGQGGLGSAAQPGEASDSAFSAASSAQAARLAYLLLAEMGA